MLTQKVQRKAALRITSTRPVVAGEKPRSAVRKMQPLAAPKFSDYLFPPENIFSNGYIKPKKHDPL